MSQNNKDQWGSNLGFLMAAVGSAVGLGNIWGFPYKMGANGGFAFLLVSLILAIFIGFVIMFGELLLGRYSGKSVVGTYRQLSEKYAIVGWMGFLSPLLILGFYCSLGGYCLKYAFANLGDLFHASWGVNGLDGGTFFTNFITSPVEASIWGAVFVVLTMIIVAGGVSGGIEKFSSVAMPALFVMLCIVIVRACTLPGATEGLAFMFSPNMEPLKTSFIKVLSTAGGQMFFSLSLGMGIMITYGSYLGKDESLQKNSIVIVLSDTIIAIMAGMAVMPAVFATGLEPAGGPGLLYMTLQNVFNAMGAVGPIFGFLFYFLVFIAAITSSISLLEVDAAVFIESSAKRGKALSRKAACLIAAVIVLIECLIVSCDGLGSNGLPQPLGFCWLDFLDCWSEGIMMPLGALIMSLIIGWQLGPKFIKEEQELGGHEWKAQGFCMICFKFIAPLGMLFILLGQIHSFFPQLTFLNWLG